MPLNILRDDDGSQPALGLLHRENQPSTLGLFQRASRFFAMPQTPLDSPNVTLLNGAKHFEIHGPAHLMNAYNLSVVNTYGGNYGPGLDIMEPSVSFGALHDSYTDDPEHRCLPGAHVYVLKRLQDWVDNVASTQRILWLHGFAGSGKSAITHTVADSNGQDKVAATFFFCRSDGDRNNGNRLFMTLAWQLALSIPHIKDHIIQSLNRNPGLAWRSVETQFKVLIVQPFRAMMDNESQTQLPPLVVIIDGIDECADENLQRRILGILDKAVINNLVPLRFLISSRLEAHIQRAFDQFRSPILCIDLRYETLEELVSFDATHDSHSQNPVHQMNSSSWAHTSMQLQRWVDNPSNVERICWLYGPAGSGKSSLARAIANSNDRGKLAATFFFDKSDTTRNDGTQLFPTLSWQFTNSIPAYKDYISQYLAECPYLRGQDMECQFEQLIVKPFEALKVVASQEQLPESVVVIDGVDKCASPVIQRRFLELIGNAVRTRRVSLRFLISSRPEGHIQETIHSFQCPVLNIDLSLVNSSNNDIQQYYLNNPNLSGPVCYNGAVGGASVVPGTTSSLIHLSRPLGIRTSAKRRHNSPVHHHEEYRSQSPSFRLVPEPGIISTFPPTCDFSGTHYRKLIFRDSRSSRTF